MNVLVRRGSVQCAPCWRRSSNLIPCHKAAPATSVGVFHPQSPPLQHFLRSDNAPFTTSTTTSSITKTTTTTSLRTMVTYKKIHVPRRVQQQSWVYSSSSKRASFSTTTTPTDVQKRLNDFQDVFVEARLCIEDATDSAGTTYYEEDAQAAMEAVQEAVDAFQAIIDDIADPDEKNRILRANGLKVEQLKGELEMMLHASDDH